MSVCAYCKCVLVCKFQELFYYIIPSAKSSAAANTCTPTNGLSLVKNMGDYEFAPQCFIVELVVLA